METILRDLRYAARGLARSRSFTAVAILTLALGIGANTAIFSVVDQLLLRPLPYPDGNQLLTVYESFRSAPGSDGRARNDVSPANWLDWQRESRTLQNLAAWDTFTLTLTGGGEPIRLNAQAVSWEFLPLLGVEPFLGRAISEDDDRPNAPRVALLSHRLWEQRFNRDRAIIGRVIQLSDNAVEVIGVMPAGFRFMNHENDLWTAFRLDRNQPWRETSGRFMNTVARLATGVSMDAARVEMEGIARRLEQQHVFNKNSGVTLVPLREELTGQVREALLVLYAAVGVLLAIACVNIANLLLTRVASRRGEIAIRAAVGAGRVAIVRQLLLEGLLLALAGGALGVVLARWSLDVLLALAPAELLRVPELVVDRRILLYAVGISVLTGCIAGLVPAALATHRSIVAALRTSASSLTQSHHVRHALVVSQVAMTVILLCGAGLLARTIVALDGVDHGFDERDLLTMEVALPAARYMPERRTAFYRQAVAELRTLPGVESAAAANSLAVIGPLRGGSWFHRLGTPEVPPPERPGALIRVVTPGYFRTLGIPVLRGREFTDADEASPGRILVNEAFARTFLTDVDPLSVSLTVWMQDEPVPAGDWRGGKRQRGVGEGSRATNDLLQPSTDAGNRDDAVHSATNQPPSQRPPWE